MGIYFDREEDEDANGKDLGDLSLSKPVQILLIAYILELAYPYSYSRSHNPR